MFKLIQFIKLYLGGFWDLKKSLERKNLNKSAGIQLQISPFVFLGEFSTKKVVGVTTFFLTDLTTKLPFHESDLNAT